MWPLIGSNQSVYSMILDQRQLEKYDLIVRVLPYELYKHVRYGRLTRTHVYAAYSSTAALLGQ